MHREKVVITEDEFKEIIKKTKKQQYKIAFLLAFASGLRVSEVTGLERRDFDFKTKQILVRQGKGSKDRYVPMPKQFKESHLNHIPMKCGVRSLQWTFKETCRKAGLLEKKPEAHFHSLRHGFITHALNKNIPPHLVQSLAGHSNLQTTNTYAQADKKLAMKQYEDLF